MKNPAGNGVANVSQLMRSCVFFRVMALLLAGVCFIAPTAKSEFTPPAQPAMEENTSAAQPVNETGAAGVVEAEAAPEPELPQPALEEIVGQAQAATPRRLQYHVSLSVRSVYDDNINLNQTNRQSDVYTTIEPTIDLGYGQPDGNFIALTYAPNAFLFVNHSENNALQHIISLTGAYRFPLLTLSLSQDVQILDGTGLNAETGTGTTFTRTNLDVAGRTRVNIYATRLNANYSLTGKTFLTASLGYSLNDYETLISSSVLSGNAYFNYTYSPKLSIGLGLAGGYNSVGAAGQDQTFEQINARASYELTGKVSASLTAGLEFRQATSGGSQDNAAPVFDGSLFYQPFDGTGISLSFSRRTQNSATLAGQDFHSTSFTLSARQRFLQKIFFGLTVGYENSEYFSTNSGLSSIRSDDYYFLQASLDYNITGFWSAGVFYFYREDQSTLATFSFYDNQFGLRSTLTF